MEATAFATTLLAELEACLTNLAFTVEDNSASMVDPTTMCTLVVAELAQHWLEA